jgi:hypothetical protein
MQISIIARQCLDQRIGSLRELRRKLRMWEAARTETPVSWQFTAENARIKLRRLYPSFQ